MKQGVIRCAGVEKIKVDMIFLHTNISAPRCCLSEGWFPAHPPGPFPNSNPHTCCPFVLMYSSKAAALAEFHV